MPSFQTVIEHGTFPDIDVPVDEPNILVNSLGRKAERKNKEYMGATTKAVERVREYDPRLTLSFDGWVSALAGLAVQHPGTSVASLLNFQDPIHEFDPDDGVMIYRDPEDAGEIEEMLKIKFDVVHLPFVN
jgi:hypothetical protein